MRLGTAGLCFVLLAEMGCRPRVHALSGATDASAFGRTPSGLVHPPRARPDATVVSVTITDRTAPEGALGVHWGMTRAEVHALAQAAGIECHDSDEYLFCPRALVPVATPAVASYEFCGEVLCSVALDTTSTRDEARVRMDYTALLDAMQRELGAPANSVSRVAAGCSGHLALCLTSRQAELRARWSWRDGSQAMVSADEDESDAFKAEVSATYLSPERARQPDPEPMRDAGAATQ